VNENLAGKMNFLSQAALAGELKAEGGCGRRPEQTAPEQFLKFVYALTSRAGKISQQIRVVAYVQGAQSRD
jgi:hypothetical protein